MIKGVWGKKIGMTQVFTEDSKVVPVTVIDTSHWFVTQIKTKHSDGYNAVQLGFVRPRYQSEAFSLDWLKKPSVYFFIKREVEVDSLEGIQVGQPLDVAAVLNSGNEVHAFGLTKGRGFQGVVKRYDFTGGVASHGSKLGRNPGARGYTRTSGRIFKGKKSPGHMGIDQRVMKNLSVVSIHQDARLVLVKGSVPGGAGAMVYLRKV